MLHSNNESWGKIASTDVIQGKIQSEMISYKLPVLQKLQKDVNRVFSTKLYFAPIPHVVIFFGNK